MNTIEQLDTLQSLRRAFAEVKIGLYDMRSDMGVLSATLSQVEERLTKLEQAQCGRISKAVERPPLEFPPEYYEKDAERCPHIDAWLARCYNGLTGSIDGIDAELRVTIQSPKEHAQAKKARAGRDTETRTPVVVSPRTCRQPVRRLAAPALLCARAAFSAPA